jgi:hypothetical protein
MGRNYSPLPSTPEVNDWCGEASNSFMSSLSPELILEDMRSVRLTIRTLSTPQPDASGWVWKSPWSRAYSCGQVITGRRGEIWPVMSEHLSTKSNPIVILRERKRKEKDAWSPNKMDFLISGQNNTFGFLVV